MNAMKKKRDLDEYSRNYSNQPYEEYQINFRKSKIIGFLSNYKPMSVLEIGCGLQSIFLDYAGFESLTVIEPSVLFYRKLLQDIERRKSSFAIKTCNVLFEDFVSDESFDFIIVSSLLHEVPDLDSFLLKLVEISGDETVIHINVPNSESFHRLLAVEMDLIGDTSELSVFNNNFQQQRVFNLSKLISLCCEKGFEIIESGSYSFKPFTHTQMAKIVSSQSVDEVVIKNLYKLDKYIGEFGSEIFVNIRKSC